MRRRFLLGFLSLAAALTISVSVAAQARDPWIGTWKLNVAKSKFEPASLAPKSQTVKQEALPGGSMKAIADGVDSAGKTVHTEVTVKFDGKPCDVVGATDANTTRVYKRIDSRTYEYVQSVAGKVTTTSRVVVSADGKTRTITATGKNAQGQTINNVSVYDRQ